MSNGNADKKPDIDMKELIKAERARLSAITKYAGKLGVPDDKRDAFMDGEQPLEQILMSMIDDAESRQFFNQKTALALIEQQPNPSAGGPADPGAQSQTPSKSAPKDLSAMTEAEKVAHWEAEFAADEAIRAMYLESGIYVAYKQREGQTKTLTGRAEQA